MYGVRIPLAFWKIIAFIHDETGKLCATGYEMNQEQTPAAGGGVRVRRVHLAAARYRDAGADPLDRGAQRHQLRQARQRRSAGRRGGGSRTKDGAAPLATLEQIRFV